MNRRGFFSTLAAVVVAPLVPSSRERSKWGGVQAYWLDEGAIPTSVHKAAAKIRLMNLRLKWLKAWSDSNAVWWINPDYRAP